MPVVSSATTAKPEPRRSHDATVRILLVGAATPGLAALLRAEASRLDVAPGRSAALALIRRQRPDLIVIDLACAEADMALLRLCKAAPASAAIPVLLLKGAAQGLTLVQALQAGADDSLPPPLDPELLRWRVRQLLRLAGGPRLARRTPAAPASALGWQLSDGSLPAAVLDALPATIAVFDRHGTLVFVNHAWRTFATLNGFAEAANFGLGSNYFNACKQPTMAADGDSQAVAAGIRAVLSGATGQFSSEYPCHTAQQQRWFMMTVAPIGSGPDGALTMHLDVTQKHLAEQALRESQRRFLELLNNSTLLSVMLDLDGRVTFCNAALLRLTGRSHATVIGSDWFATFMAAEHGAARRHFLSLLSDQPVSLRHEDDILKADGERCLICWNSSVLHDSNGKVIGTASIGEDITAQKKSALKIQTLNTHLEKMSRQLLHAQEQERISLARELHDELGQRLALLKIDLHHLQRFLAAPAAHAAWQAIDAAVVTLIAQIRVISVSLRPPALDYLGLETAVRQLLERQFASGNCRYIFEYAGLPARLAPQLEIAVYRIVQESITNIVRHAHASCVVVELNGGESGRELELIVRDNGGGYASDTAASADAAARPDGSGAGLRGMQERVALLGGSFRIDSSPLAGTRIQVVLALEPA